MQMTWGTGSDTINVRGDEVVVVRSRASPGWIRFSVSEAFHAPHLLSIDDVRVRGEVVSYMARQLSPDSCETDLDRLRLTFWTNLRRGAVPPARLDFSDGPGAPVTVELGEGDLHIAGSRHERDSRALLDDVFFHGPRVSRIPLENQRALRAAVHARLHPSSGLAEADGFPLIDPTRIEAGEWEWDRRADGESAAILGDGRLMIGYSYGRSHEQGYGCHPLARTLRGAPDLRLGCPPAVAEAIRARLAAAVVP